MASIQVGDVAAEIRAFEAEVTHADVNDLRRRIEATGWPQQETVSEATQGVQLVTIQALARYLVNRVRLRDGRGEAERLPAVHHDRAAGGLQVTA
jgi:hypothetical protein